MLNTELLSPTVEQVDVRVEHIFCVLNTDLASVTVNSHSLSPGIEHMFFDAACSTV